MTRRTGTNKPYPEEFKKAMVSKMVGPVGRSATALAKEVDIPQATLSKWLREYAQDNGKDNKARRPRDWSAEEKLRALTETAGLKDAELGEYLRRQGLHSVHLEQWRREIIEAVDGKGSRRQKAEDKRRVKELERELRRKEKALAETTALIVLKKKAQLIWGDPEEDESI
jgi:transposase-like protein